MRGHIVMLTGRAVHDDTATQSIEHHLFVAKLFLVVLDETSSPR